MSFVFKFSRYQCIPIICEWLELEGFVQFDSSVCNHRERAMMLAMWADCHRAVESSLLASAVVPLFEAPFEWVRSKNLNPRCIRHVSVSNYSVKQMQTIGSARRYAVWIDSSEDMKSVSIECDLVIPASSFEFLSLFTALESLRVSHSRGAGKVLEAIQSKRLQRIEISHCTHIEDCDVQNLLKRQAGLEHLSLTNCYALSALSMSTLRTPLKSLQYNCKFDHNTAEIVQHCQDGLARLDFGNIYDSLLTQIGNRCCRSLTALDICRSVSLNDTALLALVRTCSSLTDLNVAHCSRLTDESVIAVSKYLPELRKLNICGLDKITDTAMAFLTKRCTDLEALCIQYSKLTSVSLQGVARNLTKLQSLEFLQHLDRFPSFGTYKRALESLLKNAPQFGNLSLAGFNVETEVLSGLHARGHQLTTLSLYGSTYFNDTDMLALFPCCPNLTDVDVGRCYKTSARSLLCVVDSSRRLKSLACSHNFYDCSNEIVDSLSARHSHSLRTLRFVLSKVTLRDAVGLLTGLPLLRELVLPMSLTKEQLAAEVQLHPNLVIESYT